MRGHWTYGLLTAALVVFAFAAVLHAAAEIDPCLLDGSQHTGRHAAHACPVCCSAWIGGPAAPTAAPTPTCDAFDPSSDVDLSTPDHDLVPSPRGPPVYGA